MHPASIQTKGRANGSSLRLNLDQERRTRGRLSYDQSCMHDFAFGNNAIAPSLQQAGESVVYPVHMPSVHSDCRLGGPQ